MDSEVELEACKICGRNFGTHVIERHTEICQKAAQKKRKVFDSSKMRAQGTELMQFKGKGNQQAPEKKMLLPKKNNWRHTHQDFIQTIKAARGFERALESGKPLPPPPPPSYNPNYVQCEFCGRRFNESACERHSKFCKEQHERLPKTTKQHTMATQKQATRIQYQPPSLKKKLEAPRDTLSSHQKNFYNRNDDKEWLKSRQVGGIIENLNSGNSNRINEGIGGTTKYGMPNNLQVRSGSNQSSINAKTLPGNNLRTGRTVETYTEARQLSSKQRATIINPRKFSSSDNIDYSKPQYTGTGYAGRVLVDTPHQNQQLPGTLGRLDKISATNSRKNISLPVNASKIPTGKNLLYKVPSGNGNSLTSENNSKGLFYSKMGASPVDMYERELSIRMAKVNKADGMRYKKSVGNIDDGLFSKESDEFPSSHNSASRSGRKNIDNNNNSRSNSDNNNDNRSYVDNNNNGRSNFNNNGGRVPGLMGKPPIGGKFESTAGKFCYECGARFPTFTSKFCCECGTPKT